MQNEEARPDLRQRRTQASRNAAASSAAGRGKWRAPVDFDQLLALGRARIQARDWAGAEDSLAEALSQRPAALNALILHAQVAQSKGDLDLASARYRHIAELCPQRPVGFVGIADLLARQEQWDEAAAEYLEIACRFPAMPQVVQSCVAAAAQLDAAEELRPHFEALREESPGNANGPLGLCFVNLLAGEHSAAEELFLEVMELHPGMPGAVAGYVMFLAMSRDVAALDRGYGFLQGHSKEPLFQLEACRNRELFQQAASGGAAVLASRFEGRTPPLVIAGDGYAGALFGRLDLSAAAGREVLLFVLQATLGPAFGENKPLGEHVANLRAVIEAGRPEQVLLSFGQADIDLGLYHRVAVLDEGLKVSAVLAGLAEDYLAVVKSLPQGPRYTVCGIHLPAIPDSNAAAACIAQATARFETGRKPFADAFSALRSRVPDLRVRTSVSLAFNTMLKHRCEESGINYMDFSRQFLDTETGMLKKRFQNNAAHQYAWSDADRSACVRFLFRKLGLSPAE